MAPPPTTTHNTAPPAPQQPKRTPTDNVDAGEKAKRARRGGRRGKPAGGAPANGDAQEKPASTHQKPQAKQHQQPKQPQQQQQQQQPKEEAAGSDMEDIDSAPKTLHHLSDVKFADLDISDRSKRAIVEELKYELLTHVQNETFPHIIEGKDILAKAKTGNGKTMAFLLPTIERLVRSGQSEMVIPALVISPTRELALQIAAEAGKLSKFHNLRIACFVGGTPINKDIKQLTQGSPVDILIATPGRLLDHLGQDSGRIQKKLSQLRFLILDEADRLLDMGFRPEIMKILNFVPRERQTLLFSATLPASTKELKRVALRDDYVFVDTINEDEDQTNVQTVQDYLTCSPGDVMAVVEHVLVKHIAARPRDYKVMLFFPTARAAQFMAQLFAAAGFKDVLEMHSRKSQSVRTKTAENFRNSKRVMMFSSDVSARGVDYPDVSLVLQVGLTDRDQYIHRLGRTARAGSDGHGILVLADFETPLLKDLKDLPLNHSPVPADFDPTVCRTAAVISSLKKGSELEKSAQQSYQAWLGFYNSHLKRLSLSKERLVQMAATYSATIGLTEVPRLEKKTLKKMSLFGVAGIEPSAFEERRGGQGNGGGYGGGNGGGNGRGRAAGNGNGNGNGNYGNGNGNGNQRSNSRGAGNRGRGNSAGPGSSRGNYGGNAGSSRQGPGGPRGSGDARRSIQQPAQRH